MITAVLPSVFLGSGDSELVTVDLPLAYLRFLLSVEHYSTLWLDSGYQRTDATSEQWSLIEEGVRRATIGANGDMDANRVSQLSGLALQTSGLVAYWPMSRSGTAPIRDAGGSNVTLSVNFPGSENVELQLENGVPYLALGEHGIQTYSLSTGLAVTKQLARGLTVAGWYRIPDGGAFDESWLCTNISSSTSQFKCTVVNSYPTLTINDVDLTGSHPITKGNWHYLAWRWEPGAEMAVFNNGQFTKSQAGIPSTIPTFASLVLFGTNDRSDQSAIRYCGKPVVDADLERYYMATKGAYDQ